MTVLAPDSPEAKRIDAALAEWRQGDLALEEKWFVHAGDPALALTPASAEAEDDGVQALHSECDGLVVVTQTCDVVRDCLDRPYVEVSPLVRVSAESLREIERGRRPSLAILPALGASGLAADLDRVMTIEKSIVAGWTRTPGYERDADSRTFARALARKRMRFAFPDDFTQWVRKLEGRLKEKHDRASPEGRALRALREIRVHASPSWEEADVAIFFWFLRDDEQDIFEGKSWASFAEQWLRLVTPTGRFTSVLGEVATLTDLTAADYVESDPLDLDHLTTRGEP